MLYVILGFVVYVLGLGIIPLVWGYWQPRNSLGDGIVLIAIWPLTAITAVPVGLGVLIFSGIGTAIDIFYDLGRDSGNVRLKARLDKEQLRNKIERQAFYEEDNVM